MKTQQKELFESFQEINRLSQEGQLFKQPNDEKQQPPKKPTQDA